MAVDSLRSLARYLDVPERTLRRAAAEGLIHGERPGARRFRTSMREEAYLRAQWPLLRELRDALRTEPNVRLAINVRLPGVQLTRLQDAEEAPVLMADALEGGRVLVDCDGR
jgi:hypothetical protein